LGIELFQTETQGTVARGDTMALGPYTFTYRDLAVFDTNDGRNVARAVIQVKLDGKEQAELYPRRDFYYESQQPVTVPGVLSSMEEDIYVVLVDWQPISSLGATFKVYRNPLVNWLWLGALVFVVGTLVASWPVTQMEKDRAAHLAGASSSRVIIS
jgi:cytochrome c-type biogenesis protein CcmF